MTKYIISFNGRLKNAIGITSNFVETVEANCEENARLKLYDNYEHIRVIDIQGDYQGWTNSKTWACNLYMEQEQIIYKKIVAIRKEREITAKDVENLWRNEKHESCDNWTMGKINFQEIADSYNSKDFN